MEKTRAVITANLSSHKDFEYYFSIIDIAEDSVNEKPDVTIDCCKSLIEGVAKSILITLDNNYKKNNKLVDGVKASKLFDKAIKLISKYDQSLIGKETDFLSKSRELVDVIIGIRNDRGEISHGKFTPKPNEIISTSEFGLFVINLTDSIVSFMLKILFQIDLPQTERLIYEDEEMEAYNTWLDDSTDFPIKKAKYSQLLYENDYDEYESRYSDEFLKTDDIEEVVVEVEKEQPDKIEIPAKEAVEAVEEKPKKEIKRLVNTFDEDAFWDEPTTGKVSTFAEEESLKYEELRELISDYLFSDKKPLRDEVANAMNDKPTLKDRAKVIETLTEKIIVLADELQKPTDEEE
ncbi:MAG: abortive infection family protein [Lactococcus lactis]|nr:abortive infection family protein [Psychroflexus sp.]MDN6342072.1 abortive infection family protein [Lactococcus lactis]